MSWPPPSGSAEGGAAPLEILLVDDIASECLLLSAFLRQQGHRVRLAEHGEQALALFDEAAIDLVLMDVVLPVLDGIETTRRIKARCGRRWVPVILLSALDDENDIALGLRAGADDYLPKPVHLGILAAKLRSIQRIAEITRSLARHRGEAEAELQVATALMASIMQRQDGLRDPALTWAVHSSRRFSGDAVAAARTPGGRLVAMLADASGHGLPAAISLLPVPQVFYGMVRKDLPVPALAAELNRRLREYAPAGVFLAAAVIAVDPRTAQVEVWNGGLPTGLWVSEGRELATEALASCHLPLGILEPDRFDAGCARLPADSGAHLVFYSDGLLEAASPTGEPFGHAPVRTSARPLRSDRLRTGTQRGHRTCGRAACARRHLVDDDRARVAHYRSRVRAASQ